METLTAAQAASLLKLHPKRVQALARAGQLPAARVGRKWLFQRAEIEGLLAAGGTPRDTLPTVELSARNRLHGRIVRLRLEGLMAEVVLAIGDQSLVSIITRSSAERMRLAEGQDVYAVVKSTEVMIGKEGPLE